MYNYSGLGSDALGVDKTGSNPSSATYFLVSWKSHITSVPQFLHQ